MQTPQSVANEVEGNQMLEGESARYGKLKKLTDKEYMDQVNKLKKAHGLRDGVSNVVFNDQYAFVDPKTGELRLESDYDKALQLQQKGFKLQAGAEDDGIITMYKTAFSADITDVNVGGSVGFIKVGVGAGYDSAQFTLRHELQHLSTDSEVKANIFALQSFLLDKGDVEVGKLDKHRGHPPVKTWLESNTVDTHRSLSCKAMYPKQRNAHSNMCAFFL